MEADQTNSEASDSGDVLGWVRVRGKCGWMMIWLIAAYLFYTEPLSIG